MGWLIEHAIHEQLAAYFAGVWSGASTVLLGRTNGEGFLGYWPVVAQDPGVATRDHDFATRLDTGGRDDAGQREHSGSTTAAVHESALSRASSAATLALARRSQEPPTVVR